MSDRTPPPADQWVTHVEDVPAFTTIDGRFPASTTVAVHPPVPPHRRVPAPSKHPCAKYRKHLAPPEGSNREQTCVRCGRSIDSKVPPLLPPTTRDNLGRQVLVAPPVD